MMSRWKTIYVIRFHLPLKENKKERKKKCHTHIGLGSISYHHIGAFAIILRTHAIRNWIISNTFHRHLKTYNAIVFGYSARQFVKEFGEERAQNTHEIPINREREPFLLCQRAQKKKLSQK